MPQFLRSTSAYALKPEHKPGKSEAQSKRVQTRQMAAATRQLHMGAQTDGRTRCGTSSILTA